MDSKYRMIIVAAQRSKQLQRGARPRVDLDLQRHKPTRVALEEVQQGKVTFALIAKERLGLTQLNEESTTYGKTQVR